MQDFASCAPSALAPDDSSALAAPSTSCSRRLLTACPTSGTRFGNPF